MPFPPETGSVPRKLALGFELLAGASFVLIVFGAIVRAEGAGLACPDWPLCFGRWVPSFDAKVALEWGHRVLASALTLGLALMTFLVIRSPSAPRIRRGLGLAWVLITVQIVLGGLTVLLGLAPWTVTAHLVVGNLFCALLLWLSRDVRWGHIKGGAIPPLARSLVIVTTLLLGLQITLGGLVSSHVAGLACARFPTCDGIAWIPTLEGPVGLHVVHRLGAYTLALAYVALAIVGRQVESIGWLAWIAVSLVVIQVGIGAANVLSGLPVEVTALHSAMAAGLVLITALMLRVAVQSVGVSVSGAAEPAHVP